MNSGEFGETLLRSTTAKPYDAAWPCTGTMSEQHSAVGMDENDQHR